LRITVLVEVGDAEDRRLSGGSNFDQIEATAFRELNSVADIHNTGLFAVGIDYPDLGRPDQNVDTNSRLS